jgi:membrane fusion protein (multidrug efflux system)
MPYDDARRAESDDPRARGADANGARSEADVRPRERDPDHKERGEPERREGDAGQQRSRVGKAESEKESDSDGGKDKSDGTGKKRRSPLPWIILGLVIIVAAVVGGVWWWSTKDLQSTDDAYTDGRVVTIEPKVSGYVTLLGVTDNQLLHTGELIIQIDPRDFIAARDQARGVLEVAQAQLRNARLGAEIAKKNFPARLAQAQAQLAQAQAQLFNAQTEYKRQHSVARAATTQQNIDQSTANLRTAEANVAAAEAAVEEAAPVPQNIGQSQQQVSQVQGQVQEAQAQLDQAELNLSYARLVAPQEGWVTRRNVERGTYVTAGTAILDLVSPDVWVTANFKETQLNRMRPGQLVDISVDAYPGLKLKGHVDSIQLGSGARFSAFPAENATGNFVKIVRRVPVKIDIDSGLDPNIPLPLGISVNPTVHLK